MSGAESGDATLPAAVAESDATAATIDSGTIGSRDDARTPPPRARLDSTRYVQRDELGRGGMGRVFAADDLALGRRVAIKELLNPTPELLGRFERELALTARLQHPGIVTVHDGGIWDSGSYAYVMRLVSGQSLEQAIRAATTLEARIALLPHAIAAVDAIAYAHAQGIIHRDLKPSNVMVGDFGETVVIDWGLAKDLRGEISKPSSGHRSSPAVSGTETVAGDVVGTPAYMPREQAEGAEVNERADVYALGALLYHLLAGSPPFQGTGEAVLAEVLASSPRPLVERVPEVPPPLLAIVNRAMAIRPEDRYESAAKLSRELKRFQAGKLVAAHQYTAWELVRRWVRRRAAVVSVAALAVVVVAIVAVVSVRRVVREQRETRAALALAEQNRALATSRGEATERLIDLMLFRLYDKLSSAGRLDLLEDVAGAVRDHYANPSTLTSDSDTRKRARARCNLGSILHFKGDTTSAIAEFRAAAAMLAPLAARAPGDDSLQLELVATRIREGQAQSTQNDLDAALSVLRGADATIAEHLARSPGDVGWLAERHEALVGIGGIHLMREAFDEARVAYDQACLIAAELVRREPGDAREVDVADCHANLGDVYANREDHAAALREYQQMLSIARERRARLPDDPHRAYEMMLALNKVGFAQAATGQTREAIASYRQAIALGAMLRAQDPDNLRWQQLLASTHAKLAEALSTPETAQQAIEELRHATEIRRLSVARDPNDADQKQELLKVVVQIAMLLEATSQVSEAAKHYDEARSLAEGLRGPAGRAAPLQELVLAYAGLGRLASARRDHEVALRWHRAELAIALEVTSGPEPTASAYFNVAMAHEAIGLELLETGDPEGARASLTAARDIAREHAKLAPDDSDWQQKLAEVERELAQTTRRR